MYGLTMAAIEQVAQQGLACVTHMSFEVSTMCMYVKKYNIILTNLSNNTAGTSYKAMQNYIHDIVLVEFCVLSNKIFNITQGVLSLKNTYFEPRYILTLPLTPQVCRYMHLFAVCVHCRLIHVDTCMYNVQLPDSYVVS